MPPTSHTRQKPWVSKISSPTSAIDASLERYLNIKPPPNPSRKYIDKLVTKLLNERTAWNARRELQMLGHAAVPSLIAALDDPRFHRVKWGEKFSMIPTPLEATLELLVDHAPDEVVRIASPWANSPCDKTRKTVASNLGATGRVKIIPILQKLMQDEEGYVRSYACGGMHCATKEGRADEEFRRQAYDLLLPQCDQNWGSATNDTAETIIVLDPERAAVDFASERWLNMNNRNLHELIEACNKASILLPEATVRKLLDTALPLAKKESGYPNCYITAAAINALALRSANGTQALAESLLNHENDKIREAAAEALLTLADIPDPVEFVIDRKETLGYEALSHQQRVVYCAYLFDAEVCNGGLMQFFGNTSGDYTTDTLTALAELKHKEAFTALDTAILLIGPLAKEPDRDLRLTAFEGRWDELQSAFDPLQQAFYAKDSTSLRQTWLLYAIRHANHFRP